MCALAVVCASASVGGTGARATAGAACPSSVATPYSVQLTALTGPAGADLTVAVAADPASQCAAPDSLKTIQLKTFDPAQHFAWVRSIENVPAPGGVANLDLGLIPRDRRIDAEVLVETGRRTRHSSSAARRRRSCGRIWSSRRSRRSRRSWERRSPSSAVIAERNGDVGASADVTLSAMPGAVEHVDVPRGGSTTVSFPVTFASPVPVELTATVGGAAPDETDATNNTLTATVDITANQLASPFRVLFPSLVGYGAQFNHHLYAPITPLMPPGEYADVEAKVKTLQPELVRIFYNDNWEENQDGTHPEWQDNYASFVKVVAARAGDGRHDRHRLSEPGQSRRREAAFLARHDVPVRGRDRGPREQPRAHERPLGRGRERAELGQP